MKGIKEIKSRYNPCQVLFVERYIELLHRQTIDSYRIRLLGPLGILRELLLVIKELKKGVIFHFNPTVLLVIEETRNLIKEDDILNYPEFSKQQYLKLLNKAQESDLPKIKLMTRLLLEYNKEYLNSLFEKIEIDLNSKGNEPNCIFNSYARIDKYTTYLCSELVSLGYSTRFLYRSMNYLFVSQKNSFDDTFTDFKKFFLTQKAENYSVYFKCSFPKQIIQHLTTVDNNIEILEDIKTSFTGTTKKVNKDLKSFINNSRSIRFFKVVVTANDFFMAFKEGRNKLSELFDIINIGFIDHSLGLYDKVLIVPDDNQDNWEYLKYNYELDGNYKKGEFVYDTFSSKLKAINHNSNIDEDTKEKLASAIRYFRLGSESVEVEHEFINYWFGLEYLYSSQFAKGTINRIKDYFKKIHTLGYVQRLFNDFRDNVKRLNLQDEIHSYDDEDLSFMLEDDCLGKFYINNYLSNPLISFRAMRLKQRFIDKNCMEYLKKHELNLEHHLTRIYRTRNQIVHDAAKNMNILLLTSSLKYYLAYSIDVTTYWLTDSIPIHSIEDILELNDTLYEKYISQDLNIQDLISVNDKSFLSI
ncbi:hypothetical protein EYD45_15355 [Hyunsoonleella flava]|uniref:Apea-like HEPN domain-containing protein n=1 Tax=Hyunsoonleella flava TaxID=2527939 RepID=A0A4Q9FGT2_9FLAO|nr:hypothetical protein [Hyunsoonleella flava]TBM99790.1 hypothetical protein EYD45_15355 [Hyunsoonleella flava]